MLIDPVKHYLQITYTIYKTYFRIDMCTLGQLTSRPADHPDS